MLLICQNIVLVSNNWYFWMTLQARWWAAWSSWASWRKGGRPSRSWTLPTTSPMLSSSRIIVLIDSKFSPFVCQKIGWIHYQYQYYSYRRLTNAHGVLVDPCETGALPPCNLDEDIFKGIFARNLRWTCCKYSICPRYLIDITSGVKRHTYSAFLSRNIASLKQNSMCEISSKNSSQCHLVYLNGGPAYPATGVWSNGSPFTFLVFLKFSILTLYENK